MNSRTAASVRMTTIAAIPATTIRLPISRASEAEEVFTCTVLSFIQTGIVEDAQHVQ